MENNSGLVPLGRAVLVKPYEPHKAKDSLIELPDFVAAHEQMLEQRAVVVAVGPACWLDEPAKRAAPGDRVLVSKFAGYQAAGPLDGLLYRLVNDRDIFARIDAEKENG